MAMRHNGLAKLAEELGELQQIIGKMLQYPDTDIHPDGVGSLRKRLQDEMGDVEAALYYVKNELHLDRDAIMHHRIGKVALFEQWKREP